jgi:predicted phage terminase large subunit-like protein
MSKAMAKETDHTKTRLDIQREVCRSSLLDYIQTCDPKYIVAPFHERVASELQLIHEGRNPRLLLNAPRRHGKTRLVSVELATWILGLDPSLNITCVSYSADRAVRNAKDARNRLFTRTYQLLFPETQLVYGDKSSDDWRTTAGGGYRAVGIGGALTGYDSQLLIVDDPFKDFEEAHSPTMRQKVWDWFLSVAYTGLTPTGSVAGIMTRWNVDDLTGRLTDTNRLEEFKELGIDEAWNHLNFPAIAEANDLLGRKCGEPLFPQRYDLEWLQRKRAAVGNYIWTAMYQGHPIPKGGNYMDSGNFIIRNRDECPAYLRWCRFWDLATTEDTKADFTAGISGAMDAQGNLWLRDCIAGQWEWPRARQRIVDTALIEKCEIGIEAVAGFKTAYQNLEETLKGKIVMREYGVDRDKLLRALPWIALIENHQVFLVAGDWVVPFKEQCEAFPAGAHDDMVDAVSGVFSMVSTGNSGQFQIVPARDTHLRLSGITKRGRGGL